MKKEWKSMEKQVDPDIIEIINELLNHILGYAYSINDYEFYNEIVDKLKLKGIDLKK